LISPRPISLEIILDQLPAFAGPNGSSFAVILAATCSIRGMGAVGVPRDVEALTSELIACRRSVLLAGRIAVGCPSVNQSGARRLSSRRRERAGPSSLPVSSAIRFSGCAVAVALFDLPVLVIR
jgi:hypothetical protein